jgi:hypothetical protein
MRVRGVGRGWGRLLDSLLVLITDFFLVSKIYMD